MPVDSKLRRRTLPIIVALALLGACAGDSEDARKTKQTTSGPKAVAADNVSVSDFAFSPEAVTVAAGATVTWTNEDDFDHSIVIDEPELNGPKFGPQSMPRTFSHRFETAGTYPYICGLHNSMKGTVVVT